MHDARQVRRARDFDRPLDERLRDRHERLVEHRLEQPVALLLLPGGEDHRRAGELGVVERAHRVAEPRRDVHVHHRGAPGRLGVIARRAEGHALVQGHDVTQPGIVQERVEDRALGGAGVAEDVLDLMGDEALHEDLLAAHAGYSWLRRTRPGMAPVCLPSS